MSLKSLSNEELIASAKKLSIEERKIQTDFLWHLLEIQNRKLYLDLGFPSLFEFVVKHLGYSESSAYRRIQAMRLMRDVPSVAHKLEAGTLNLTTAAQAQRFLKNDLGHSVKKSYQQKLAVVEAVENKSTREVEKHFVTLRPESVLRTEKVRTVTNEVVELKLMIPNELRAKMDQLKFHFSHSIPDMTYLSLIEHLSEKALLAIRKKQEGSSHANAVIIFAHDDRQIKEPRSAQRSIDNRQVASRHIPSVLRHAVWMRDQGYCSFVDPASGRRCKGKYQVQVDHIIPWSRGGDNSLENLRLLCGEHNRQKGSKTLPENKNNVT